MNEKNIDKKEIEENIFKSIKSLKSNVKNLSLESQISELGLDSLDIMDLVVEYEEKYKIRIPDDKLQSDKVKKVLDVVDIIYQQIDKKNKTK